MENFSDLLDQSENTFQTLKERQVIKGVIVDFDENQVVISIGGKSEGYIPVSEFSKDELVVGSVIDVYLKRIENKKGELILSRETAKKYKDWNDLKECLEKSTIIKGTILGIVKGGFAVQIGDVIAFLPKSQVDTVMITDEKAFVGKEEDFKVIKINDERGNVVVSRKIIIEEDRLKEKDVVISKLNIGDIVEGTVKNLTDYGAFIECGNFDGLIHLTDMSWLRVNSSSEIFEVGQVVKAKIINIDHELKRVSLGIKQMQEDPWKDSEKKFPVSSIVKGKVKKISSSGVFVSLENGISGLVYSSEVSWIDPSYVTKTFEIDQEIDVKIISIDSENRKLSMSIKQCYPNPFEDFTKSHKIGDIVKGVVKNIKDFGIFVELPSKIVGLVHISDIDHDDLEGKNAIKKYEKGMELDLVYLCGDSESAKISLGIKQLSNANFKEDLKKLQKGNKMSCFVKSVGSEFLDVELDSGMKGIVRKADVSSDKKEQRTDKFNPGDRFDVFVVSFDAETGKLLLSIKNIKDVVEEDEGDFDISQYMADSSEKPVSTLGSLLSDVLGNK